MSTRLEADRIDRRIDLGGADPHRDQLIELIALREIDRLEADGARMIKATAVHIADEDDGGAEQPGQCRGGESTGPAPAT